jgi:hypothetical protein
MRAERRLGEPLSGARVSIPPNFEVPLNFKENP